MDYIHFVTLKHVCPFVLEPAPSPPLERQVLH